MQRLPELPAHVEEALARALHGPRYERGPALAQLIAAHPEHEEHIRRYVATLELDVPTEPADDAGAPSVPSVPGYRLVRALGGGSFGTVYLAESDDLAHAVAIKVLRPGLALDVHLPRFRIEQQVLARLTHPNIAHFHAAGTTQAGAPFFAMEFVDGDPLTEYCDEGRLPLAARVDLVCQLCAGVQHAHLNAVIHRDLKPSNVLVANQGGDAVVKVIDFGLARAPRSWRGVDPRASVGDAFAGTPSYMSPEQASGDGAAVDVRTDVYAVGAILYDLLVGDTPLPQATARQTPWADLPQRIREHEPLRPSVAVLRGEIEDHVVGARGGVARATLARHLRGELDWIVLKALAKEPARRYQSVADLAADLVRWRRHEPVQARGPSVAYRLRKFARRNWRMLALAAALLVAVGAVLRSTQLSGNLETARRAMAHLELLRHPIELEATVAEGQQLLAQPSWPELTPKLEQWLDQRAAALGRALPVVRAAIAEFDPSPAQSVSSAVLRPALATLELRLVEFLGSETGLRARVEAELGWSRQVHARSVESHRTTWQRAREAIRASPAYAGRPVDLEPQLGLVPIGANPKSGLWEFYHLRSAADPTEIPRHDPVGGLAVGPETGLVFVLVPGGTDLLFGAQKGDSTGDRYDADAFEDEGLHRRPLEPYFLSRFEMTKAQWRRLAREEPRGYEIGFIGDGMREPVDDRHPVAEVHWHHATDVLAAHGLRLPDEHEWEHACRAGTDTPFYTGTDAASLAGYENLNDQYALEFTPWASPESFNDEHVIHARVGSFMPNAFGFHDMHGNLIEWCANDYWTQAERAKAKDKGLDDDVRTTRGAAFDMPARMGRASARDRKAPDFLHTSLGVRPARSLLRQ